MAQGKCLRSLNPVSLRPGVDYALFLLRPSGVPYAVFRVMRDGCCTVVGRCSIGGGLDVAAFEGVVRGLGVEARRLIECASNALKSNVKPNCGVPEVDEAVKEAQAVGVRNRGAVERVDCLISSIFVDSLLREASSQYTVIKSLDPCGLGTLILLPPGNGIHELPQSKLGIARLLSQLLPDYIQVVEGWGDYTRLAYLIQKAPRELLTHITALAGRVLGVELPGNRLEALIAIEALLSRMLGVVAVIDIEGEEPFIVKYPKAPFNP